MAWKDRKSSEGDVEKSNVGKMKPMKRKMPKGSNFPSAAVENVKNPIHDDDADELVDDEYDFLKTFPNDDSSDNDDDVSEGEAEDYENSGSDSDDTGHGSANITCSDENSEGESDSDAPSGSEHNKSKLLFNATTSETGQSQFKSFTKSLFKSLDKPSLSSKSIGKNKTNDIFPNKSMRKVKKESMVKKGPTFEEVILERMKQSQENHNDQLHSEGEKKKDNKLNNDQVQGKSQKVAKKPLPLAVNEFLSEGDKKMKLKELRHYEQMWRDAIEKQDRALSEEEVDNEDTGESDAAEESDNDDILSDDDDHTSEEETERVGLKRDTVGIGKQKSKSKEHVREDESNKHVREDESNKHVKEGEAKEHVKEGEAKERVKEGEAKENTQESEAYDEYEHDTSDEEDVRNTIGNIPLKWYEDYRHVGYNQEGKKILKPPSKDRIDEFIKKMYDRNYWRTVEDPQTGHDIVLSNADAEFIKRLQSNQIPDADFKEYAPWIDWFSSEVMEMPLRKFPEHKRSFIPSKDEARMVSKLVSAMKKGYIQPKEEKSKDPVFYNLWESDTTAEHMRRIHDHIPAPKRNLPNHAESYNPPAEYLFDKKELKEWNKLKDTPSKRKLHFIPRKFNSLREVPLYDRYIKERFYRCLDLYLCPRARKMKLLIQPEDLVPQLPSPKDLQPFPTTQSLIYKGHADMVRTITVEPKGQYLASGSDDMTVKIWEVSTGRCVRTIPAGGIVRSISWCPNPALSLLAVAADRKLLLINPDVGDKLIVKKTDTLLEEHPENDVLVPNRVKNAVQWEQAVGDEWKKGVRIIVNHFKEIKQVTWHGRGDYFATVMTEAQNRSVIIHQISKRRSQIPFSRSKGLIQCVLFHPVRPFFFVATQKNVRVYDLMKQEIVKKLMSNAKWISTMAVHPGGDNLLVATYDRKILWFDLDLSTSPYQTLRMHSCAVRGVAYHKRYPLFASCSDDNSVIVSHGMVYNNDFLKNPLIVPLKRLTYHEKQNDFSAFDLVFHPSQPWLFSSGADGTVRLYT